MRTRIAAIAVAAAAASLAVAAPAGADSIVYIKKGNVWKAKPDGSKQRRLTRGGHWSSPSQANDGTILALNGSYFVRMRKNGKRIGKPFAAIGSGANSGNFEGPYDPEISPNGRKIAYSYLQRGGYLDYATNTYRYETKSHVTVSRANRFTDPSKAGVLDAFATPSWIGNKRLMVSRDSHVASYVVGQNNDGYQNWYADYQHAPSVHHLELSPRGDKLAVAHGDLIKATRVAFYTTNGSPWVGGPPYDNYSDDAPHPNEPSPRCELNGDGEVGDLSWSPDGRRLAMSDSHGVYVTSVGDISRNCDGLRTRLVIRGAKDPDWGPAR